MASVHGRHCSFTLFALLLALMLPSAALAADGDLDTTFGGDGQTFFQLSDEVDSVDEPRVAQAPDGSLVVGMVTRLFDKSRARRGTGYEGVWIFRVSPDGGEPEDLVFRPSSDAELLDVRVLPDGRIGFVWNDHDSFEVVLDRITATGENDPTLTNGTLDRECSKSPLFESAVVRPDGGAFGLDNCGINAYLPSGEIDTDFAEGIASLEPEGFEDGNLFPENGRLAIAPDGKLLALVSFDAPDEARGQTADGSALVRYEADGDHDATFEFDGVALLSGQPGSLAVGPDNRPVVSTSSQSPERGSFDGFVLQRLTAAGQPDDTFGEGGAVLVEGLCCPRASGHTVQKDDKIVVVAPPLFGQAGRGDDPPQPRIVLRRYLENGEIDTTFADEGDQVFLDNGDDGPTDASPPLMQSDGKIVVAFGWVPQQFFRAFQVAAPGGRVLGVARFANPSLAPPVEEPKEEEKPAGGQTTTTTTTQTPVAAAAPAQAAAPPRRCTSRRSFRIRLRTGRRRSEQSAIVSTRITVNGRRVPARRRGATVNLRNLPKGRFTVVISLRLADGGRVRDVRRYRTCAQKIERELAPLRTRPPGRG